MASGWLPVPRARPAPGFVSGSTATLWHMVIRAANGSISPPRGKKNSAGRGKGPRPELDPAKGVLRSKSLPSHHTHIHVFIHPHAHTHTPEVASARRFQASVRSCAYKDNLPLPRIREGIKSDQLAHSTASQPPWFLLMKSLVRSLQPQTKTLCRFTHPR